MKNIQINLTLPTTRQQGGALDVSEILHNEVELSADGGASFSPVPGGPFTPDVLQIGVNDLPVSDQYQVRGRCVDTASQPGNWAVVPFAVADDSPPGDLVIDVTIL